LDCECNLNGTEEEKVDPQTQIWILSLFRVLWFRVEIVSSLSAHGTKRVTFTSLGLRQSNEFTETS